MKETSSKMILILTSEDDCTDVFMVISDLKKNIEKYEEEYRILRSKGFDNVEKPRQTVSSDLPKYALILVIFH